MTSIFRRCPYSISCAFLVALVGLASAAQAKIIHVPADQPTIQAGINAASNGDTVLVSPGTYFENINFMGKAITVTSSDGPTVTIIDGGGVTSVVTFKSGEGSGSVLSGFTLQNGYTSFSSGYMGGGVSIAGSSPQITENIITGNTGCSGIGVGINGGSPLVQGNTISNNRQTDCSGGNGGGILIYGGSPRVIGNTITNNQVLIAGSGGGIELNGGSATIQNNVISGNAAAGISCCSEGGGIDIVNETSPSIVQNLIIGNSAPQGAGVGFAVPNGSPGPLLVNNTIANNDGSIASAVYASGFDAQTQLFNNLLVSKAGQTAVDCNGTYGDYAPVFQSNDVFSKGGTAYSGTCANVGGTNGNISADPVFLNSSNNFHLQPGSPAVGAGKISAPGLPSADLDGNPRTQNGTVDMGVYEFSLTTDSLSPTSFIFPPTPVGTTSAPMSVALTNTGTYSLYFAVAASGDFAESDSCNGSVPVNGSCSLSVTFTPTQGGTRNGTLTLVDNTSANPQLVSLAGTGEPPIVSLSPTSLTFPNQLVETTSSPMTVTLTNTGAATLHIFSIGITGDFSFTTTCGSTVAPGASCTFAVSFTPTAAGVRTGALSITDDAAGSPQQVALSGTGYGPGANLSPTSLNFGQQNVGTTSAPQTVTLSNPGDAALVISSISTSGDFAQTNNCPGSLAPEANCLISVTFSPTSIGTRTGFVSASDNVAGSPQSVSLSGLGVEGVVSLSPTSLNFSDQYLYSTSAAQTVWLYNTGNSNLLITSIFASGDFAQTNNCPSSLGPGGYCMISVSFSPTAGGTRTGVVTLTDSAVDSPQNVPLTGTGMAAGVTLTPASLNFGNQNVGTSSAPQTVMLTNSGSGTLVISSITVSSGDFTQTNNCGGSVAAGASCSISVVFSPASNGAKAANLTISDNVRGATQTVSLIGSGVGGVSAVSLAPASLDFGFQNVGTTSLAQTVTLTNTGSAMLTITNISVAGDFSQSDNCLTSLWPGYNCSMTVKFTPTSFGTRTGAITVTDNALDSPQTVSLAGTGANATVNLSPSSLTFGSQTVGTTSAPQTVTLSVGGTGGVTIQSIAASGDFVQTNNCGGSVSSGGNCTITVSFQPTNAGTRTGSIAVNDSVNTPQTVSLSGTGTGLALQTIHVPGDEPTIQLGIGAATNGDTVLVSPGTYFENIDFEGKAITVTSVAGPSVTIIDGGGTAPVVTFQSGEGAGSVLSGFTIQHGSASYGGGGISIANSSPHITGNIVISNTACYGAGIYAHFSSALIQGNTISNNSPGGCYGGTMGGGIEVMGAGSTKVVGNIISNNSGTGLGGGGIGLYASGSPIVQANLITGNSTSGTGGGILTQVNDSGAMIVGNLIAGNYAPQGGGVALNDPISSLVNNTVSNNQASQGSALWIGYYVSLTAENNLLITNSNTNAIFCQASFSSPTNYSFNDAYSRGSAYGGACSDQTGSNGNISADPMFLNGTNNFHLQPGSPAIDTGNNSAPGLPSTDLDGNPRIQNGTVDMGAYEFGTTTITVSPASLDFGSVQLYGTSPAQSVTLTNTGSYPLYFAAAASGDFRESDTCNGSLSAGGNCSLYVTFSPTAAGSRTGALTIVGNTTSSPQQIALSGDGFGPGASLSPSSVNFGSQNVGTSSPAQAGTLTNTGDTPLTINGVGVGSSLDFSQTNNCPSSLPAGGNCSISVVFSPAAVGARAASLTIADNTFGSPQVVALLGNGTNVTVSLSPGSLSFGNQGVGTTSARQQVTLTVKGSGTLTISSITTSGDFAQTNTCGNSVPAGNSCYIYVTFTPTDLGTRTGSLTILDSAFDLPETIPLSGTGVPAAPSVSLSPTSLVFGNQMVGSTSPPQSVTLTSTGTGNLSITSIVASGDFAQTNNCPSTLAPSASCTTIVTFTPTQSGNRTGAITITDNAGNSPQAVPLSGTGVGVPIVSLSPTSLTFGSQDTGTTSPPQNVILSNTGAAPLSITSIAASPSDFAQTNNCGNSLAAGANCTISVTFSPKATGTRNGSLTITDNNNGANGSTQTVSLTGTGINPGGSVSPTSLSFGNQVIGTTTAAKKVTLTSTGTTSLIISGISIVGTNSGDFAQTNNCPTSMAPGAKCTINVTFTPTALGARTATLAVADNAANSPQTVALSGAGILPVVLSPTSLNFGNQAVATTSAAKAVTLTNNLSSALTISSITTTGDFAETDTCDGSVPAKGKCTINVTFTPTTTGTRTGTLTVTDNVSNSPQTAALTGTGVPQAVLSPTSLTFGAQKVGTTSAAKNVTLTDNLSTALALSGITFSGANQGDFAQTNNCGASVPAKSKCTISVTFTPTAIGTRAATLNVNDSANNSPQTVLLTGTGK